MYIDYNVRLSICSYLLFKYRINSKLKQLFLVFILNKLIDYYNDDYLDKKSKICLREDNLKFDDEQIKAIYANELFNLVIAGAGSGKTSLIVGKINYLIEEERLLPNEIICLSFTNEACYNLKSRLKYNVEVLTFHKLSLLILNGKYRLNNNYLKYEGLATITAHDIISVTNHAKQNNTNYDLQDQNKYDENSYIILV